MAYFDGLTTAQVAALTTAQVAALTSTDLESLTSAQIPALTTLQISVLPAAAVPGFTSTAIPYLETADLAVFSTDQIVALESTDVAVLTTAQVATLSTAQLSAMEAVDIGALSATQLDALSTDQVAALNVNAIADLNLGYSQNQVSGSNPVLAVIPPNPMPVAIPTGTTWSSGVFSMNGFNQAVAAILANQILTVTVQRYMNSAGTLPVGAAGTLTSTANTAGYTSTLSVGVPATHLKVTVANASGDTAIVSAFAIGLQSN